MGREGGGKGWRKVVVVRGRISILMVVVMMLMMMMSGLWLRVTMVYFVVRDGNHECHWYNWRW